MHRSRRRSGAILVSLLVSLGLGCGTDTASTGTGDIDASYSKLDATLRARLQQTAGASTRPLRARDVAFFAETDDADRTRREAATLGGRVNTVAGNIVTVQLPEDALLSFAASSAVTRLEGARPVRARLDTSLPATKADKVHLGESPLTTPYKGKNVVVGVIDMGLDLTHDAFRASGASRVVALWDQMATGTAPPGFTYGQYCDAAALTGNTCTFETTADHGTHVTGIAAGAKVDAYEGMAPESDIVFVHLGSAPGKDYPESLTTAICDGANFIFQRAAALGKPAVVNMSLGEHTGSHDGQGLADKCLDNLAGQGKILVAAAGNEGRVGETALHAQATASSTPLRIYFRVNGGEDAAATVGLWFESGVDLSVKVGVLPSASDPPVFAGGDPITLAKDLAPSDVVVPNGGGTLTLGKVAGVNGSSTAVGPKNITVVVNDDNKDKEENKLAWVLEITGNGAFDAYLDTTQGAGFFTANQPAGVTVNNAQTIGFPGSASKVLAVASYVTRNQWVKDGTTHLQKNSADQQVTLGALSEFSSRGPARVSTVVGMKPDIAAPGEIIAAPLNSKHTPAAPERVLKPSPNGYLLAEGTSMATPAVTGIVALMLERNRDLTVEQIRTIFANTANTMDAPGAPNTSWGAGKIDALAAVNAVTPYVAPPADAGTDSDSPVVDAGADGSAADAGTDSDSPVVDAGADGTAPSTPDAGSSAPAPTTTPGTPPTTPTVPASPPTKSDIVYSSNSTSSGCQTTPAGSNPGGSLALLPTLLAALGFRRRSLGKKPSSRL